MRIEHKCEILQLTQAQLLLQLLPVTLEVLII